MKERKRCAAVEEWPGWGESPGRYRERRLREREERRRREELAGVMMEGGGDGVEGCAEEGGSVGGWEWSGSEGL
jgi:hypothetical protein